MSVGWQMAAAAALGAAFTLDVVVLVAAARKGVVGVALVAATGLCFAVFGAASLLVEAGVLHK